MSWRICIKIVFLKSNEFERINADSSRDPLVILKSMYPFTRKASPTLGNFRMEETCSPLRNTNKRSFKWATAPRIFHDPDSHIYFVYWSLTCDRGGVT